MKKLVFVTISLLCSLYLFSQNYEADQSIKSYRQAIIAYDSMDYGSALKYSEDAILYRKQYIESQISALKKSLSAKRVQVAGDNIQSILQILEQRNEDACINIINYYLKIKGIDYFENSMQKLLKYLEDICFPHGTFTVDELADLSNEEIIKILLDKARSIYSQREEEFGQEQMREIERVILLRVVDQKWMAHIDNMDHLKQGMGLRAYKQQDPIQAYQMEGSAMFDEMIQGIKTETVKLLYHVRAERPVEREKVAEETGASHGNDESVKNAPVKNENRVGRNDMCPCGSGKKYKNCCGREA